MPILTVDMLTSSSVSNVLNAAIVNSTIPTASTATGFTLASGIGSLETAVFTGTGLTYDVAGVPTGGTITSIDLFTNGNKIATLSGLSEAAAAFYAAMDQVRIADNTAFNAIVNSYNFVVNGSPIADATIEGAALGDTLNGNLANDTFFGGAGADTFFGGQGIDAVGYDQDTLLGGNLGVVVDLGAGTATDGFGATDTLNSIEGVRGTQFADALTGSTGDDFLEGLGGDDTFFGLDGNDVITLGTGVDTAFGGIGDDTIIVGTGGDSQDFNGGAGVDTAVIDLSNNAPVGLTAFFNFVSGMTGANETTVGRDTFTGIENLTFSGAWDATVTGDASANVIITDTGADSITGGAGNDVIRGGAGADSLDGGADIDTLDYSTSATSVTVDLVAQTASGGDAQGDTIAGFENVIGGLGDDTLTGDTGANTFTGGKGNDIIDGSTGDDRYIFDAGDGQDKITEGGGRDTLQYGNGLSIDDFFVWVNPDLDLVLGVYNAVDFIELEKAAEVLNSHIEVLEFGGAFGVYIGHLQGGRNWDDTNNVDTGTANNDFLNGRGGDDSIHGGQGSDVIVTGTGNDTINGGEGQDVLWSGTGNDVFIFDDALTVVNADIILGFEQGADQIHLDSTVFSALSAGALAANALQIGTAAVDADDRIIFDATSRELMYDADGVGGAAAERIGYVAGSFTLTEADFMIF